LFGILLGLAAAVGALTVFPAVDQYREASIIAVAANGGIAESFHVNIPSDRIVLGAAGQSSPLPEGLEWPSAELLKDVRIELFKVRNERDIVVGIGSRTAVQAENSDSIEWVIHLPARGSIFVMIDAAAREDGQRTGTLRAGSREFSPMVGTVTERWIADDAGEGGALMGRIELLATYVSDAEPAE